jgi:hypothetical protein
MRVNCRSRLGFGVVLLRPERVRCWSFSLSTIGHCAWRHFISFSNGCEKETPSKENAYKRQQVASALAQFRPWSESSTTLASAAHH